MKRNNIIRFSLLIVCVFLISQAGIFNGSVSANDKEKSVSQKASNKYNLQFTQDEKQWLKDHPIITARVGAAPPLHFMEGSYKGISVDYLNLIAARAGFQVKYVTDIPWAKALDYIKKHERVDLLLTAKITEERKNFISFTENYLFMPWVIFTRSDIGFISGIEDLNHKTVSVEQGYVMHQKLMAEYPNIKLLETKTSEEAIEAVATGLADAHIGNLTISTYIIQQNNLNNLKIAAPTPFGNHNQAMGIRNDWPQLTNIINKTLNSLTPEEHESIRDRWLSIRFEYGISKLDVFKWVLAISIFSITIIGAIMFWNKRLQKEITERKKAEEAIKRSESLLNTSQQLAKVGGWEWDVEKQTMFWTDEIYRIHEFRQEEFSSGSEEHIKRSIECYEPEDHQVIMEAFRNCIEKEQAYDLEFPFTTAKKRQRWIRTIAEPIRKNGMVVKVVGNLMDITERKQLEEKLRQTQKMESIGNLAGGIAHDFNNLLYPIIGFAEMLKEDLPSDSPEHESAQEIFNAGKRGGELVKQILAFSRQADHKILPVRFQKIVTEVCQLTRSTIPSNIQIHQDIQKDCGLVMADATQLHQIAMNLITNAYHAVEKTNGEISVQLKETIMDAGDLEDSSLQSGQYAMLSVSDNGVGIPLEIMNNIFEPYFTTKEKGKGTGLGLAVVYGILTEHKGDIKVYSEVGKGTTFNVYLPLMKKSTEAISTEKKLNKLTGTERILLVDDEESVVRLEKLMLERLGYNVSAFSNSLEALETFNSNPDGYDLVISDMTMPNMTGDKLAQELMSIRPDIPIIICTGFSERINKEQAEANKVKGFLMKPVVKSEMAQMVRNVLDEAKVHKGN